MAERTRKAPSSIDQLPPDILVQLQELLRNPRVKQLAVTAKINALLADLAASGQLPEGAPDKLSNSAVNRYDLRMRKVGERLQQSREVAEMWIGRLGAGPQGQLGHLTTEIFRTLAFEVGLKLQEIELTAETMPEVVEQLRHLSLVGLRLEKAASENVKREEEIRKQTRQEAADQAVKAAKKGGLSADTVEAIRKQILGIN